MHRARPPIFALCLFFLVAGTYLPALRNEFCNYDDPDYVTMNKQVQKGITWTGIAWAFSHSEAANWHPLTWISHMLDCQLFDLKPWGHHLTSVLLHCANVLLLFYLLSRMTGSLWRSFFVAALFGVHPLHVESVAWVAERKDVLSTLFFLLALFAYAKYVNRSVVSSQSSVVRKATDYRPLTTHRGSSFNFYALALLFFALGLMCKPMLVTLPFILLLLDFWPLQRLQFNAPNKQLKTLILEKLPFFALTVVSCVLTFLVQRPAMERLQDLSLIARLANALISYCRYLGKFFWPSPLIIFYPHPDHWPLIAVLAASLLLAGITLFVVKRARDAPFLLVGWLWFVGSLVPVIGLVQVGLQAMADRYAYIPSMGFFTMVVWGINQTSRIGQTSRAGLGFVGAGILIVCAGLTIHQLGYWRDSEVLFRHDLAFAPHNEVGLSALGNALNIKKKYLEGAECFQEVLQQRPHDPEIHFGLAYSLLKLGRIDGAMREYQEVLRLRPRSLKKRREIGNALLGCGRLDDAVTQFYEALKLQPEDPESLEGLGDALLQQGRTDAAIGMLELAIKFDPKLAPAHDNLGIALTRKGRVSAAVEQFQKAIRLKSDEPKPYNNLGMALQSQGRLDEAIVELQRATRLKPDDPEIHNNLGVALGRKGRLPEATRELKEALRLKPDYAQAHNNLAVGLRNGGQLQEAVLEFEAALKLNDSPDTHVSLGMLLEQLGRKDEAITHFRAALKLRPNFPEAQQHLRALTGSPEP